MSSFLLHYRTTPHTATGKTPAELLIKRIPRTKLSLLRPEVSDIDRDEQRIKFEEATKRSRQLDPGCKVSVWNPRQDSRGRWMVGTVEQQLQCLAQSHGSWVKRLHHARSAPVLLHKLLISHALCYILYISI